MIRLALRLHYLSLLPLAACIVFTTRQDTWSALACALFVVICMNTALMALWAA